jgi:protein LTV1
MDLVVMISTLTHWVLFDTEGGTFIDASGKVDQMGGHILPNLDLPEEALPSAEERDRMLESITLSSKTLDRDLAWAMEHADEVDDLPDDFVTMAAQADGENDEFDFDAHIRKLMGEGGDDDEEEEEEQEDEWDDDMPTLEDDVVDSEATRLKKEHRRQVEQQFEQVLGEYDEDKIGELDEFDDKLQGHMDTEDPLLDTALEEYLHDACKIEYSDALGLKKITGKKGGEDEYKPGHIKGTYKPSGAGHKAGKNDSWHGKEKQELRRIVQTRRQEAQRLRDEEDPEAMKEVTEGGAKKHPLGNDATPGDGCFADGVTTDRAKYEAELQKDNPYLREVEKDKWDCDTIISTYSNLDNNPSLIDIPVSRKKKSTTGSMASYKSSVYDSGYANNSPAMIELSKKTGLPLGVLAQSSALDAAPALREEDEEGEEEDEEEEEEEGVPENKGARRQKGETKEQKKERKDAIKAEKQVRCNRF